jgi:hypothetical protein
MSAADDDALKRVDEFANDGTTGGAWKAIPKDDVVKGLRERVHDKDGLNQQNTGLCAEASLVHIQLQDDPLSFVNLAVELYKTGRGSWRGRVVTANQELLANPPPDGLIVNGKAQVFNRADWIVMSSIRNTINPADNYSRSSSAGTPMEELETFIRQVGYTRVEGDYSTNSFSENESNVKKANELLDHGYRVILLINACMLHTDTQADYGGGEGWLFLAPKPNHVVQLIDDIDIYQPPLTEVAWIQVDLRCVKTTVYTWAEGHHHIPENGVGPGKHLFLSDFLWNYYGYLAFKG